MKIGSSVWLAAAALVLAGCGNSGGGTSASSTGSSRTSNGGTPIKVGMVFDSGGRGDKSFNDSAYAGLEKAEKELGVEAKTVDSKAEKDYEGNLIALSDQSTDLVFAVGLTQGNALKAVAPKYPNINYAIIDGEVEAPNVRSIKFKEEQGSFLAGYLAGLMTKTNKIGFVGGMNIPLIHKFEAGYFAGAKTANPAIETLPAKYTGSWDDTQLGKTNATVLFNSGADIVYHAAGRSGIGVIDAAKDADKWAIGVDSDQDYVAPGHVLASMVKHVDVGVYETIKDVSQDKFQAGTKIYDLKDGGVGLSDMKYTKDKIGKANLEKIAKVRQDIIDGKIMVPSTDEELQKYLAALPKA